MLWGGGGSGGGLGRGSHSDEFFSAPVHPQSQTDFMNYLFDTALQQEDEVSNTLCGKVKIIILSAELGRIEAIHSVCYTLQIY